MSADSIQDLWHEIEELRRQNATHRKRGFRINDLTPAMQSCHLLEETVELQAEVLNTPRATEEHLAKEASHVLACFLHLLQKHGLSLEKVAAEAIRMCRQHWTTNPEDVVAREPGFTRKGRGEIPS
jgi:NTP pyrophosphatase (non-canonical NTP hydrolase)